MKKRLCILIAILTLLSVAGCSSSSGTATESTAGSAVESGSQTEAGSQNQESGTTLDSSALYSIGSGATGGTFNAMGSVFAQFFNDGKNYGQFSATATTGGVQNVMFMRNGTCDFGIVGQSVYVEAREGSNSFDGQGVYEDLVVIAPLYSAVLQQFVSEDIKSEADLKGKKLVIGAAGSGDVAVATSLYDAMGMSFDDFEPQYLGSNDGAEQMKDGHVDGALALTQLPFSTFVELTNADKAYLIALSDSTIANLLEANPGKYYSSIIPADTYKNQTEDLQTVATGTFLCTTAGCDEELVYQLTKYICENIGDLNTLHAALSNLTVD